MQINLSGMTILFDDIVFGPVNSRRFGISLGMNLLPVSYKYCTFNCVYCECGWTFDQSKSKIKLPTRIDIITALEARLKEMLKSNQTPDNITFAGNGEPTVHPEFDKIIDDTIELRNQYFPETGIAVLSNASQLHKPKVFNALNKIEHNVLKLDSVIEETFQMINQPAPGIKIEKIIEQIKAFDGNQVVQTLFIRGTHNGRQFDNTTEKEVNSWLNTLLEIRPKYVMIYPIERDTPLHSLEKITETELNAIANRVEDAGIHAKVYN